MTDHLSILYVTSVDVSLPNGPGVNEREFLTGLAGRSGLTVSAVVPASARRLDELRALDMTTIPELRWAGPFGKVLNQLHLWRATRRMLRKRHFDLVVCRLPVLPWGVAGLLAGGAPPVFLKTLGDTESMRRERGMRGILARPAAGVQTALVKYVLRRVAGIDACTPELIAFLTSTYGVERTRLALVPNATNTERFRPDGTSHTSELDSFEPLLGYVGGRPFDRGGRQIIEALAQMKETAPRAGAFIAGGQRELLERHARSLGVMERCVIPGQIPYDVVPTIMPKFDVAFALDLPDRLDIVGNSNQKVRQYLACGVPVVTTRYAGDFVRQEDVGRIVSPDDTAGIVEACMDLIGQEPEERQRMRDRARDYAVRELSVDAALTRRLRFWQERLAEERSR